jgi:hypothetical protein
MGSKSLIDLNVSLQDEIVLFSFERFINVDPVAA